MNLVLVPAGPAFVAAILYAVVGRSLDRDVRDDGNHRVSVLAPR